MQDIVFYCLTDSTSDKSADIVMALSSSRKIMNLQIFREGDELAIIFEIDLKHHIA